jgi:hypothetical protein
MTTGVPGDPPLGVMVIDADAVDGEMNRGPRRCAFDVALGTTIRKLTVAVAGVADARAAGAAGVVDPPPPPHPAVRTQRTMTEVREVRLILLFSDRLVHGDRVGDAKPGVRTEEPGDGVGSCPGVRW